MGETELVWIAAERSLPAVEHAESPLLMAASAYHPGHAFLRAGQVEQAAGVTMTAARALEPGLATATPEHLSAWGVLHLTALIAVARQDDPVAVRQLLGEARATADRLGQGIRRRALRSPRATTLIAGIDSLRRLNCFPAAGAAGLRDVHSR